jgi:hypothetical protein
MKNEYKLPTYGIWLIHLFAGPTYAEFIVGDFEEKLALASSKRLWFWKELIYSAPSLLTMQLRNVTARSWIQQTGFLLSLFGLIISWELMIARSLSWPIAKQFLSISPLSAGDTCRLVYVLMYGLCAYSLLCAIKLIANALKVSAHFKMVQRLFSAIILSAPALYLLIFPLPTDGVIWFRLTQIALIWLLAFPTMAAWRGHIA